MASPSGVFDHVACKQGPVLSRYQRNGEGSAQRPMIVCQPVFPFCFIFLMMGQVSVPICLFRLRSAFKHMQHDELERLHYTGSEGSMRPSLLRPHSQHPTRALSCCMSPYSCSAVHVSRVGWMHVSNMIIIRKSLPPEQPYPMCHVVPCECKQLQVPYVCPSELQASNQGDTLATAHVALHYVQLHTLSVGSSDCRPVYSATGKEWGHKSCRWR